MKWFVRIAGGLVALAGVSLLGLWIASNRRDAGRMQAAIEIARPPEDIWPWMTEPDKLQQWVGWLDRVEPDSTSPSEGIGHREIWIMNDPRMRQELRVPGTITLWEPPTQMGVHIEVPSMFVGDVLYSLDDLGNGRTRVKQDGRVQYTNKVAALMEPMVTPDAMRKLFDDMKRLRDKVEATPYEPVPEGFVEPVDSTVLMDSTTRHPRPDPVKRDTSRL
jgi:uncharacterized protein YndB with AHSA1/START domain